MALDWYWITQDDGTEIRVQSHGDIDGRMGFDILEFGSDTNSVWTLNAEVVEWLRDRLSEWLRRQGGS
jgi:hypothetical protein